jgi:hypothetical protein
MTFMKLGERFPILYSAMRDNPKEVMYQNPEVISKDIEILLDHFDYSPILLEPTEVYFKSLLKGIDDEKKLIATIFRGMSKNTTTKQVFASLVWGLKYKIKSEEHSLIQGDFEMSYLNKETF